MVPLLQELLLSVLSAVFWREVDGNVVWQMLVDHHAAVVQAAVIAAQVLQNNV
jgi:CII-binding regulator of phage lambda lysogenization HflD